MVSASVHLTISVHVHRVGSARCTRVTACLENLEMSRNLTAVREMSEILVKKQGNVGEKNLVREKLPKTVYCKLHICVHTGLQ